MGKQANLNVSDKLFILSVTIGLFSLCVLFIGPEFVKSRLEHWNISEPGQIGDVFGGTIGPFIAWLAAILTFFAFWVQYKSNLQQKEQFEKQANDAAIEKFQNKYFELIRLHRDNVSEINIGKDSGKKIFVLLIREFRGILEVAKKVASDNELKYSQEQLFIISYVALFYGVGKNSSRMLKSALDHFDSAYVEKLESVLNSKEEKNKLRSERGFKFTPFEGHQSRLGHYYRHLYQTVTFVNKQIIDIDKYEYVKTIRAQLTTHEQALLFINSLCPMGRNWRKNDMNLLLDYRLVKNIPRDFFNKTTEINIESYFNFNYFEWQEQ